jgi:hypothetical protein
LGREGRWAGGLLQMRAEKNKKKERSWVAGEKEGRECLIFFLFSNPFQIFFKPF